jgi:polyisoprenoid-binding protein YceI
MIHRFRSLTAAVAALVVLAFSAAPALAADVYDLDGAHSSALFRVKHLNIGNFYGRFNNISGTISIDKENLANSSVNLSIAADSVDTGNAKRDNHLKSPDFFNAKQFPTLTFKSTAIEAMGENKYKVTGDFTMLGQTKSIAVEVEKTGEGADPWGGYRVGAETSFSLKRSDFGMNFMQGGLGDEVRVVISVEAIRRNAEQ